MTEKELEIKEYFDELRKDLDYKDLSDLAIQRKAEEMYVEVNTELIGVDKRYAKSVYIDLEICLLFLGENLALMGFYLMLICLLQLGYLNKVAQKKLSKELNMSFQTFENYKNILYKMNLINLVKQGNTQIIQFIQVIHGSGKELEPPKNIKDFSLWLSKIKKKIILLTPEIITELENIQKQKQEKININNITKEAIKKHEEKKREKKKREDIKFPEENYEIVIRNFKKYKGIGLIGDDYLRTKRWIKSMFKSGHSPKEIVDCMKFFHDNQNNDEYAKWMPFWTIETIMKKMPEFKAGKLKVRDMLDDYPVYK